MSYVEQDGTLELVLYGRGTIITVEACAIELTPLRAEVSDVCRAACDHDRECGLVSLDEVALCLDRCERRVLSPSDSCLEALAAAYECTAATEGCAPQARFAPSCPTAAERVNNECVRAFGDYLEGDLM